MSKAKKTIKFIKEMVEQEKKGKAAAAKRVQKAGQNVRAVEAKAAVKRKARKQNRAISDNTRGMKKVKELSNMDKLELEFDKLTKTAQRAIISKARKGEKTKYSDMLEIRKGIEREGKTAERKARQKTAVENFNKRQVNRKGGSSVGSKKDDMEKILKTMSAKERKSFLVAIVKQVAQRVVN